MAFTPAPSASKSFGSEVTAAYFTRFGDHIAWRTSSGRHTAGHGSPAEMVNSNSFQSWQNRVTQRILENHAWGLGQQKWSSLAPAHCGDTLQDRRVHTGSRWSKRGLGQLATIKANCHVANTTLAPPSSQ
jgi:hypothetical protein